MSSEKTPSIGSHLRDLLGGTAIQSGVMAESVGGVEEAARVAAAGYVPHSVPQEAYADEVAHVARKAVADEPLDEREGFIAEAIILPDLRLAIDIVAGDYAIDHPA